MSFTSWLRTLQAALAPNRMERKHRRQTPKKKGVRPHCEVLEDRTVPSTFTVTTTADNGDDVSPVAGSLRAAIISSNAAAGADTIAFNIPGAVVQTITPTSALPTITDAIIIDGYTQPGSSANTLAVGDDSVHLIELSGAGGAGGAALIITAGNSTIRGLVINRFTTGIGFNAPNAIELRTNGGNTIEGNFLGLNAAGTAAAPNRDFGVLIQNSPNNTIGGTTPAARNVISGNNTGIQITQLTPSGNLSGNTIQGNYIGTNAAGTAAFDSGGASLSVIGIGMQYNGGPAGSFEINVGGPTAAARNVISGDVTGISLYNSTVSGVVPPGVVIQGNYIGTNAAGTSALGYSDGILLTRFTNVHIGGAGAGEGNVISGNPGHGIRIANGSGPTGVGNLIQGNLIGTNAAGTAAIPNIFGISIEQGQNNTIGGTTAGARNIISGSTEWGLGITSGGVPDAMANVVQGNFIGTDITGMAKVGNARGVVVAGIFGFTLMGTNTIGGTTAAARNVISGNGTNGISISSASNTLVQGNFIGTDVNGTADLGNGNNGVELTAANNTIGGAAAGAGNVIAFNGKNTNETNGDGIHIFSGTGNSILGNSIFSNQRLGIDLVRVSPPDPNNGVTANDTGDADTGANNLQNCPVLSSAASSATTTTISGTLNSLANTAFRIEFFANAAIDPSDSGEGQTFVGVTEVTTDGSGNVGFAATFATSVPVGRFIAATSTRLASVTLAPTDTSEFSGNRQVVQANTAPVAVADSASTSEDNAVDIPVLANDTDADNPNVDLRVQQLSNVHGGTAVVLPDGRTVRFTPSANANDGNSPGGFGFSYTANDGTDTSANAAAVTITVSAVNDGTFFVITTADNGDDFNPVAGSLRAAMIAANGHANGVNADGIPTRDRIVFAIPGAGAHTIQPLSGLPTLTDSVVLDATTQPGFSGTPLIELDGSLARNSHGLVLTAGKTTVRGLVINRFVASPSGGIVISGQGGNVIQGNYIGTNRAGDAVFPAGAQMAYGVIVFGSNGNFIGTDGDGNNDAAEGNVISGQNTAGVLLQNGAAGNVVAGNRVGTNAAGDAALGNGRFGVFFLAAGAGNRIGTNADGVSDLAEGNLISGNVEAGIFIDSDSNLVASNYIGTSADGSAALPNGAGVVLHDASHNTIGGTDANGNLIADNTGDGVAILGASTDNHILGNTLSGNGGYDTDLATAGTADVAGAGSGSFFVAAGGTFNFAGYEFGSGSSFAGTGIAQLGEGSSPYSILGDFTLSGGVEMDIEALAFIVLGSAAQDAQTDIKLVMAQTAKLHIKPGGTIAALSGQPIRVAVTGDGTFVNDGLVDVATSTFSVGAGSSTGTFQVADGGALEFLGGYDFGAGTSIVGAGTARMGVGAPNRILGDMSLAGVTLSFAGNVILDDSNAIQFHLSDNAKMHIERYGWLSTDCQGCDGHGSGGSGGGDARVAITGDGTFVNDGLVDVGTSTFSVGAGSSTGTFQVADQGALEFLGGYDFGAGTSLVGAGVARVMANGPPIRILGNMTLDGVTLENAGNMVFTNGPPIDILLQSDARLHNLSAGTIAANSGPPIRVAVSGDGTFVNDGLVDAKASTFQIGAGSSTGKFKVAAGGVLEFLGGHELNGNDSAILGADEQRSLVKVQKSLRAMQTKLDGVTLENAGIISVGGSILLQGGTTLHNLPGGTIAALIGPPFPAAAITGNGTFVNDGLVDAKASNFQIGAGRSSGAFQVSSGGALQFLGGYSLEAGTSITGLGFTIIGGPTLGPIGSPIMPVVVDAAISIPNLTIGSGGLLSVEAFLTVGSTLVVQAAGKLRGTKTIIGNVVNSGFVSPGLSPGTLTINGNYTQTAAGVLQMEIGGSAAGQFDRLIVTGTANLGGTLDVVLVNGYTPPANSSFPILQYHSRTGNFSATTGDFSSVQLGAAGLTIKVQAGSTGKATGEGRLGGGRSFEFEVQGKVKHGALAFQGELEYRDRRNGIRLESTAITAFHIDGDGRHATFSGTAKVNGKKGYRFVVDIVDGAGGKDQFRIRIYQNALLFYDSETFGGSDVLEHGKIKVRR